MSAFRYIVEARLPVTPVPGLSSLRLRLAGEKSGLGRLLAELGSEFSPYWAHVWAGGLALAHYLEAEPGSVRGRRVIDYGTGSGLVAIAAAKAGAREVIACDIDPLALEAVALNAALNGVEIVTRLIRHGAANTIAGSQPEIVLAGDVFYDAGTAERTLANLKTLAETGAEILVGDPFRPHLPQQQLALVARYDVADFALGDKTVDAGVFRLRQASTACS